MRTGSFQLFAIFGLTIKDTCLKKWLLGFFSSIVLDLDPVLEKLFAEENDIEEEIRIWLVEYTKKLFAWHLNCHFYFHILRRFLFSHCICGLYCFGGMFKEANCRQ